MIMLMMSLALMPIASEENNYYSTILVLNPADKLFFLLLREPILANTALSLNFFKVVRSSMLRRWHRIFSNAVGLKA
jgi:hypothetical protein